MADVKVDLEIDYGQVALYITDVTDNAAQNAAAHVQTRARVFAPKKTGRMALEITIERVGVPGQSSEWQVVANAPYSEYQEFGTGPIFAKPGGVLVWNEGGATIFAHRTSGVPATHFMRRAGDLTTELDFIVPAV